MTQLIASSAVHCCVLTCLGKLLEILQICRRKLLLLSVAYIHVVSLFGQRNPPCCVSAEVRTDEQRSILHKEVLLPVAYLLISLSGNCKIELLEFCVISLELGDISLAR